MKKVSRFLSLVLMCCCLMVCTVSAQADEMIHGNFNTFESITSASGVLNYAVEGSFARSARGVCTYSHVASIDSNSKKTMRRASSTLSLFGVGGDAPTFDLYLNVYLYRDGHSYTSSSSTKYQASTLTVSTKYVAGSASRFGVSATGTITDDSGTQIYKKTIFKGNPFD